MNQYRNLGQFIGQYPALGLNSDDICLSGELGEIWAYGDGTYRAFYVVGGKNEKIISFSSNELDAWVKKLKVPYHRSQQSVWANNPNKRLK